MDDSGIEVVIREELSDASPDANENEDDYCLKQLPYTSSEILDNIEHSDATV